MAKKKAKATEINKIVCRKFTLRDKGGVLDEVELLIKDSFPKQSLNSYIIQSIQERNTKELFNEMGKMR